MGLENLKSVFNDLSENTLSEKGIHGGLTNERPSTPAHPDDHSLLDLLPNVPLLGPDNLSMSPTLEIKGRHGGLTNESPSTPEHPQKHSLLDMLPNVARVSPENLSMNPTLEFKGRHGGLTNEFPPTPPHPDDHSELDNIEDNLATKLDLQTNSTAGKLVFPDNGSVDYSPLMLDNIGINSGLDTFNEDKITNRTFSYSFDPLTLGKDQELGKGDYTLETLYNVNHTAVTDRIQIDTGRKDHTGKTIEINTLRAGMGALGNLDINAYKSSKLDNFRGFDRGNEPYIIKPIGSKDYTTLTSRDGLPFNRAKDDTSRLLKFYGTGAGLAFIAKENVINFLTSKIDATNLLAPTMAPPIANPLQGNTGFLNITNDAIQDLGNTIGSLRKPLLIEYSKKANTGLPFGNLGDNLLPLPVPPLPEGFLTDESPGFIKKKIISAAEGLLEKIANVSVPNVGRPTPFMDLSGGPKKTEYDDKINKSGGIGGFVVGTQEHKISPLGLLGDGNGDFYVRFKDLRHDLGPKLTDGVFLYFRGFVTGIVENVNPSFTSTNYIGRSEPVYQYERAERDLSFNLRVYPNNKKEFDTMYKKLNYLTGMAYPMYLEDKDNSSLTRMKAPFTELYMAHIGSRAKGQFGFIKSISYTVNESGDWDSQTSLPRLFDIAISYQILSKRPPSFRTPFYRGQNSIGETA